MLLSLFVANKFVIIIPTASQLEDSQTHIYNQYIILYHSMTCDALKCTAMDD